MLVSALLPLAALLEEFGKMLGGVLRHLGPAMSIIYGKHGTVPIKVHDAIVSILQLHHHHYSDPQLSTDLLRDAPSLHRACRILQPSVTPGLAVLVGVRLGQIGAHLDSRDPSDDDDDDGCWCLLLRRRSA